jgi:hypothetical protein
MDVIILSYKFGQTWDALTLQNSWNDLQFEIERVIKKINKIIHSALAKSMKGL